MHEFRCNFHPKKKYLQNFRIEMKFDLKTRPVQAIATLLIKACCYFLVLGILNSQTLLNSELFSL